MTQNANGAVTKGQLISKAIYGQLTSPNKRTDEFVLFAFLLFTADKTNSSVCFLGESTARQSAFRFYLTFSKSLIFTFHYKITTTNISLPYILIIP